MSVVPFFAAHQLRRLHVSGRTVRWGYRAPHLTVAQASEPAHFDRVRDLMLPGDQVEVVARDGTAQLRVDDAGRLLRQVA